MEIVALVVGSALVIGVWSWWWYTLGRRDEARWWARQIEEEVKFKGRNPR